MNIYLAQLKIRITTMDRVTYSDTHRLVKAKTYSEAHIKVLDSFGEDVEISYCEILETIGQDEPSDET